MLDKTRRFVRGIYEGLLSLGITTAVVFGVMLVYVLVTTDIGVPLLMRILLGIASVTLVIVSGIAAVIKDADNVD